jgi:diguanylate cyclase (GGDEF)-like protein
MVALTDIPNRRSFDDRIQVEWRRCFREQKPVSLLMLDLDRFKTYNDTYGHPQGDAMLKAAAKVLASSARRPADIAARIGGEEFGVLLPDTALENALAIAEKIRAVIEALRVPTADGTELTTITASVGVASKIPGDCGGLKDFITKADEYLYAAKTNGRNRVYTEDK